MDTDIVRHMVVFDRLGAYPPSEGSKMHVLWVHLSGHRAWELAELAWPGLFRPHGRDCSCRCCRL